MSGLAALRPRDRALVTRRPLRPEDGLSLATTADMPKLPALILVATYAGLLTGAVFLGIYAAMAWATGYTANALLIATLCLVAGFVLAFATILRRGPARAEGELVRRDIESGEVDELVLDASEAKAFREPEHGGLMSFLWLGDGRVCGDIRGGIAQAGWDGGRAAGSVPYERVLMDELLPLLEARHPGFGGTPQARSLAGLSMGGFGALNLAARTGAFSRCLALSPAFVDAPFTSYQWFIRRSLRRTFPLDPVLFAPWNPWSHLGGDAELVIGAGTEDRYHLAGACRDFARLCADRGRPVQVDLRPGGHDWAYWTPMFKDWMPWLVRAPDRGRIVPLANAVSSLAAQAS